ncbi:MAG: hypothetical protein II839_09460 [Kiritimatiellae bacterium]|nr:hypothetical protein [Kiritimatiellia bacterium]
MGNDRLLDFRFAVSNTEILVPPSGTLETFGNTILGYVLVCETMDSVDRCRIRTGRMKLARPQIVTPSAYSEMLLEGFGEEARKYAKWLAENEASVRILRYGYTLRRESFSEEEVGRPLAAVAADAKRDVESRGDPYLALVQGVDEPWDVCLVRLFWEVVSKSARKNFAEMAERRMFDRKDALGPEVRDEIERAFAAAERDPSLVKELGALLQKRGAFEAYEERFFALVRR